MWVCLFLFVAGCGVVCCLLQDVVLFVAPIVCCTVIGCSQILVTRCKHMHALPNPSVVLLALSVPIMDGQLNQHVSSSAATLYNHTMCTCDSHDS